MNARQLYEIWAPREAVWSDWAKPVVFAQMPAFVPGFNPGAPLESEASPAWWSEFAGAKTALVLDLPGPMSVTLGLAAARCGWRPVPLYNAVSGFPEVVDVHAIQAELRRCAPMLSGMQIAPDAPPAFLLDADRRYGHAAPLPGAFDNRSVSLPTDFPSAQMLTARGIERAVLVQVAHDQPQADLAHTLLRWQEGGVRIFSGSLTDRPWEILVHRPSLFRDVFQRFAALIGLRRNPLGGFGGTLPEPSAG